MASQSKQLISIPRFRESEIRLGRHLGQGTYCTVTAVQDIVLLQDDFDESHGNSNSEHYEGDDNDKEETQQRQRWAHKFAATRHRKPDRNAAIYGMDVTKMDDPEQEPAPKLAVKRVRVGNSGVQQQAQDDLQRELDILRTISNLHPNIIDLVGIGISEHGPNNSNSNNIPSFLILSQIRTTLTKRLARWRDEKGIGLFEALNMDIQNRQNLWVERLVVLSKIAHALQHMHFHQILNRDVKPDNVGFDATTNIPKLFDFGLAKRICPNNDNRGLFQLTPDTGTLRYMAVEVGTHQPYGWTADVYSLAIVMHEVLSLKVPFGGVKSTQFRDLVWSQGQRLPLDPTWPQQILTILPKMWHPNPLERPSMEEVTKVLDAMLRGSEQDLFPTNLIVPSQATTNRKTTTFTSLFSSIRNNNS